MTVQKCAIDLTALDLRESSLAWMATIQHYLRTNRIVRLTIATIQVVNLVPRLVTCAQDVVGLNRLITSRIPKTAPLAPDFAGGGDFNYGPIVFTTPEI